MLSIVVREFGEGQQVVPIVLLVVAIDAEILLGGLICPFCLAVSLRMEGCRKPFLEVEGLGQGVPKLRGKNRATVGDNRVRKAVEADNMVQEQLSEFRSCGCLGARDEMAHLCESVDDNENRVVSLRGG